MAFAATGLQKLLGASDPPVALVQVIPGWVTHVPEIRAAWSVLGGVEVGVGVGLILARSAKWPVYTSGGLLTVFGVWIGWQVFNGRTTCGCGSGVEFLDRIEVAVGRHMVLGASWWAIEWRPRS